MSPDQSHGSSERHDARQPNGDRAQPRDRDSSPPVRGPTSGEFERWTSHHMTELERRERWPIG
jgi:hypothetical protein